MHRIRCISDISYFLKLSTRRRRLSPPTRAHFKVLKPSGGGRLGLDVGWLNPGDG